MRFDDRQGGQRTGLALDFTLGEGFDVIRVDACGALEQTRVQVEHVARIRFTAWRTAQQQGNLAICNGLLGQIVIHDQRIFAAIAEVFTHRAAGVGRDVLHRRRFGSRRSDDDGVFHRAVGFQRTHDILDRRRFLTDSDVDTDHVLAFLIDDRIDRDRGLPRLAIADFKPVCIGCDTD